MLSPKAYELPLFRLGHIHKGFQCKVCRQKWLLWLQGFIQEYVLCPGRENNAVNVEPSCLCAGLKVFSSLNECNTLRTQGAPADFVGIETSFPTSGKFLHGSFCQLAFSNTCCGASPPLSLFLCLKSCLPPVEHPETALYLYGWVFGNLSSPNDIRRTVWNKICRAVPLGTVFVLFCFVQKFLCKYLRLLLISATHLWHWGCNSTARESPGNIGESSDKVFSIYLQLSFTLLAALTSAFLKNLSLLVLVQRQ